MRLGPAVYIPCLEGFLAAAVSSNPQLVQAAIVLARLAGWKLAVWNAPDDPTSPRPRYRPPPPSLLRKPEKEATDATTRAIALAARAISETDFTIIARADRGPCLLAFGGRRATKATVLAQVTSAAHIAMQQFVRGHYTREPSTRPCPDSPPLRLTPVDRRTRQAARRALPTSRARAPPRDRQHQRLSPTTRR